MGAKSGKRTAAKININVIGTHGPIAQLLHPLWIARNNIASISHILQMLDEQLSLSTSEVKLVVSGGGFIEVNHAKMYSQKTWRFEETIDELVHFVQTKM
jgi:hypothetical protein